MNAHEVCVRAAKITYPDLAPEAHEALGEAIWSACPHGSIAHVYYLATLIKWIDHPVPPGELPMTGALGQIWEDKAGLHVWCGDQGRWQMWVMRSAAPERDVALEVRCLKGVDQLAQQKREGK